MKRHNIICVDFDGVIHDAAHPIEGRRMGAPIKLARTAVEVFIAQGFKVIVLTANVNHGYIREWLAYYGFPPYITVTNVKPLADVYIDDKAVRFEGDWNRTMYEVEKVLSA